MTAESKPRPRKSQSEPGSPSSNGTGAGRPTKGPALVREVAAELNTLRATLDEMTEHFRLRAGAQISELLQTIEGDAAMGKKPRLPAQVLEQLLEQIREVRIKPRKGRAKDFVRLQQALEDMVGVLPAER
jgi:hypothetical protein